MSTTLIDFIKATGVALWRRKRLLVVALISLALCIQFPVIGLLFLTAGVAVWGRFGLSHIEKYIVSLILVIIGNVLLYELFNIARIHPPLILIGLLYVLTGWVLLAHRKTRTYPLIRALDIVCLLIGLTAFFTLLRPAFFNPSVQRSPQQLLHLLSSGEDNASHYALFKYAYLHGDFTYTHDKDRLGVIGDLVNYPQASEFTMGWIAKGTLGYTSYQNNEKALLYGYYTIAAAYFSGMVLMICLVASRLYRRVHKSVGILSGIAIFLSGTAFLTMGPLLSIMGRGFHSQTFAYMFLALLLYFVMLHRQQHAVRATAFYIALAFAGICNSWWYLVPIALAPLAVFCYRERRALLALRWQWIAFIGVGLLGIYPVILSALSTLASGQINAAGGVDVIAPVTIALYVVGALGLLSLTAGRHKDFWPLSWALIAWLLFTIAVGVYQKHTVGHFEYYYYKSFYTLIPLSMIIVMYLAASTAEVLSRSLSRLRKLVIGLLLVALSVIVVIALKPIYIQVYVHDWFNNRIDPNDWKVLFEPNVKDRYSDILYVGGCPSGGGAYLANRFSGAVLQTDSQWRSRFTAATLKNDNQKVVSLLSQRNDNGKSPYIFVQQTCLNPELNTSIRQSGLPNNLPPLDTEKSNL